MNARKLLAGLSLGLFCHTAQAGEPIADLDKFEASYIACIEKEFADGCFESGFEAHQFSGQKANVGAAKTFLDNWRNGDGIYKVHPIERKSRGGVYQKRYYLIEREAGSLMLFNVRFRTVKGSWYLVDLQASNDEEVLREVTFQTPAP
ncbi:hypothetical protein [Aquipseudomonas alcaligenes]|uniref:DUF4019 domain-containing protein n=1 Tax=Aquipseudomonas alcaligenes TaxID=43263 RepID=A0AA37CEJ3_AQUAC|nr:MULTISPECIES: hypothetical protein [Pseudomonas]BCR26909.1 hypothetical protein KAM426_44360 [Pseudomonas alcaligenes]GIZ65496.1 hypothetical protein KAM428_05810 [Pseudomonas alcaligenes]GIZ69830.1 hypothetical protein KAM429_05910 [Pseudomonas alcaligenes]GIZ74182.1 hypothetical protein KAM430_05910 [Pseudomonas alcaligenes]GIZ78510.1 hypothetical protein KAM432_05580 [Pseudomonas alcaligenes]